MSRITSYKRHMSRRRYVAYRDGWIIEGTYIGLPATQQDPGDGWDDVTKIPEYALGADEMYVPPETECIAALDAVRLNEGA